MKRKIETRHIDQLIPYARNSRIHSEAQVAQIAASIREWGWTTPVLITKENTIIAGHGRVMAARKLEMEEIPCIVAEGWTEAQVRAYVIADNRLAENAAWDMHALGIEMEELRLAGFDIELTGFDDDALGAITSDDVEPPESFKDVDEDIETEFTCPKCGYQWAGGKS